MTHAQQIKKLQKEILEFVASRKSLQMASLTTEGAQPFSSYAPFAIADDSLFVLISEIAIHGANLLTHPVASVLIIEDEDSAEELFARKRVSYQVGVEHIQTASIAWQRGIEALAKRHGSRIDSLSQMDDFKLFRLTPIAGRYIKGFGQAFAFAGPTLTGSDLHHLKSGHRKRQVA